MTNWQTAKLDLPLTGDDVITLGFTFDDPDDDVICDIHPVQATIDGVVIPLTGGRAAADLGLTLTTIVDGENMEAPDQDHAGGLGKDYAMLTDTAAIRIAVGDATAYEYDENGNASWKIVDGKAYELKWDEENRLEEVVWDDPDGDVEAVFTYDGDGRRTKAQRGTLHTFYVGDLLEYTEQSVPSWGKHDLVGRYDAGGERVAFRQNSTWPPTTLYWVLRDHLSSTSKTIQGSNLTLDEELRYTPWGETRHSDPGNESTQRRYTGQFQEEDLGLYYYNARYYDPGIGRFISPDTIVPNPADPADMNRYTYARGNPVRYNDPSGHIWDTLLDVGFIGYDLGKIHKEGWTQGNVEALALDLAGAALPFVTGLGIARRVAKADNAANIARYVDEMAGTTGHGQKAARRSFLSVDGFASMPRSGTIDPQSVRFSQDTVTNEFRSGGRLDSLISGLRDGSVDPRSIPPIRLVVREGKVFTLDNRRLATFQQAGIDIAYVKLGAIPKRQAFKFTTTNEGVAVSVISKRPRPR